MSDKQKEASTSKNLATLYFAIAAIFDRLPSRFKLKDALQLANLKDGQGMRSGVAAVLYRDFKCINVGQGLNRVWKKP